MQNTITQTTASINPTAGAVKPTVTVNVGSISRNLDARILEASRVFTETSTEMDQEDKLEAAKDIKEKCVVDTIAQDVAETKAEAARLARTQVNSSQLYVSPVKVENSWEVDDSAIEPRGRSEYVFLFKAHQRRTALAALDMCRVVYEAFKTLAEHDFDEFCKSIGYKHDSSTVRKFLAIGKVYPRMIEYADQLPAAWTSIYSLTQMPADDFENCIKSGYLLCNLTGGEVDELVKKTRVVNNTVSPFKQSKKEMAFSIATVFFTKQVDDADFRLLQKAFDEVASRLPVKLVIKKEATEYFEKRRSQRFEKLKQEAPGTALNPSKWDYGTAANNINRKVAA
ncbi:hypothetical protein MCEMAEM4_00694 [Burkholderiaceae bacterium]